MCPPTFSVRSTSKTVAVISLPCNLVGYIQINEVNEQMKKAHEMNREANENGLEPQALPLISSFV